MSFACYREDFKNVFNILTELLMNPDFSHNKKMYIALRQEYDASQQRMMRVVIRFNKKHLQPKSTLLGSLMNLEKSIAMSTFAPQSNYRSIRPLTTLLYGEKYFSSSLAPLLPKTPGALFPQLSPWNSYFFSRLLFRSSTFFRIFFIHSVFHLKSTKLRLLYKRIYIRWIIVQFNLLALATAATINIFFALVHPHLARHRPCPCVEVPQQISSPFLFLFPSQLAVMIPTEEKPWKINKALYFG